jgi:hypothetical protein
LTEIAEIFVRSEAIRYSREHMLVIATAKVTRKKMDRDRTKSLHLVARIRGQEI